MFLELQLGHDVLIFTVEILAGLELLTARRHNDDTVLQFAVIHPGSHHDTRGKVPLYPGKIDDEGVRDHVDLLVLVHLVDQLCQEGLNVLSLDGEMDVFQISAQLRLLFHEEDFIALFGKFQSRRHPGHASADDQALLGNGEGLLVQGDQFLRACHRHSDQVLRLFCRLGMHVHVNPGTLIPDISHFEQVLVQPRLSNGGLEERFVGPWRTGRHDHPVEFMLRDHLLDMVLGVLGTGKKVVLGIRHVWQGLGIIPHGRDIDDRADIDPAVTDEHPDSRLLALHTDLFRELLMNQLCPPCVS